MSNTFRELFDQDEREEILVTMNAKLSSYKSRLKRCRDTEQATNTATEDRLENKIAKIKGIIDTIRMEMD